MARERFSTGRDGGNRANFLLLENAEEVVFANGDSGQAKNGAGGGAQCLLVVGAHGSGQSDVARRPKGLGGADQRAEVAGVLQAGGNEQELPGPAKHLVERESRRTNEGRDSLRRFGLDRAGEDLGGQGQYVGFLRNADLVEQRFPSRLHEYAGDFQPAGNGLQQEMLTLNRKQAAVGSSGTGQGGAKFLYPRILPTLYNANGTHGYRVQRSASRNRSQRGEDLSAEILRIHPDEPEPDRVQYVVSCLRSGKVAGIPTDTFYGLAVDPVNLRAVKQIYEIKSRLKHKPLSLLVANVAQAYELSRDIGANFDRLAERFWPGPLTVIVKASSRLPLRSTANTGNVALRVPDAAIPRAIVEAFGLPITATSATLAGEPECVNGAGVRLQLGDRIPLIVDGGPTGRSVPTTIVDLSEGEGAWRVLREGAIPTYKIALALHP